MGNLLTRLAKNPISRSLEVDLLPWRITRSLRSGTLVLGYHGVAADEDIRNQWVQRMQIPASVFRKQLEFIGNHFEVVSADDVLVPSSQKRRIHLSFDDGYSGFLTSAAPLLNEFGFPASVYVVTGATSNNSRLPTYVGRAAMRHCEPGEISLESIDFTAVLSDELSRQQAYENISSTLKTGAATKVAELVNELISLLPEDQWGDIDQRYNTESVLGWEQLATISGMGFTVGAHSVNHLSLSNIQEPETIEREVNSSVGEIRRELGKCDWFAFPNGTSDSWSKIAAESIKKSGVKGAWILEPGIIRNRRSTERFRLPRFSVPRNLNRLKLMLNTAFVRY